MSSTAEFIRSLNTTVRPLVEALDRDITRLGCESYVKTIYVGYAIGGAMVAAVYPHQDHADVALALREDHDDPRLFDASHLKWRTLPLAARVSSAEEAGSLSSLLIEAASAVQAGSHTVDRSVEYFTKLPRRTSWYR